MCLVDPKKRYRQQEKIRLPFSVAVFLPISCNGEVPVAATGQKAETEGDTGD